MCGQTTKPTAPPLLCTPSRVVRLFSLNTTDDSRRGHLRVPPTPKEISEGLFPHIAKPRQNYDKKKEERPVAAVWSPLFRLQLNRLEVREAGYIVDALSFCLPLLVMDVAGLNENAPIIDIVDRLHGIRWGWSPTKHSRRYYLYTK